MCLSKYPCFDIIYRNRISVGLWEKHGLKILKIITFKYVCQIPLRDFFCHLFVEVNIVVVQIVFLWSSSSFYRPSFSKTKNTKTDPIEKKLSESKLFSTKQLVLFKSANMWNTRLFSKTFRQNTSIYPVFVSYQKMYLILNFYNLYVGIWNKRLHVTVWIRVWLMMSVLSRQLWYLRNMTSWWHKFLIRRSTVSIKNYLETKKSLVISSNCIF